MRRVVPPGIALLALLGSGPTGPAQDPDRAGSRAEARTPAAREPSREERALAFVREHHPELAGLLDRLRPMDPGAFEEAIEDLARTAAMIDRIRRRNPERAAVALRVWKAKSRVDLLTARLISRPSPAAERRLREALAEQVAAQLEQQRQDRAQLHARLEQIDENIRMLERRGDALVNERFQAALKKAQRVRRLAEGDGGADGSSSRPARRSDRPENGGSTP